MEPQYNNAAGRLLALFQNIVQQPEDSSMGAIWAKAFSASIEDEGNKISRGNFVEIYRRLVAVWDSLVEIEETTRALHPNELNLYLRDFDKLRLAIAPRNLEMPWNQMRMNVSDAARMALELNARDLPKEGEVTGQELASILVTINELRRQVHETNDLPNDLKEWIFQLLRKIQSSIVRWTPKTGQGDKV